MKKCTRCLETKPLTQFNKHRSTKDGRQSACRECESYRVRFEPIQLKPHAFDEWIRLQAYLLTGQTLLVNSRMFRENAAWIEDAKRRGVVMECTKDDYYGDDRPAIIMTQEG